MKKYWIINEKNITKLYQKALILSANNVILDVGSIDFGRINIRKIPVRITEERRDVSMATVFDVANWFLSKQPMTHKKLQKLCYYAQAWNLALHGEALIAEDFEAWVHGPVCRELYYKYSDRGWAEIQQASPYEGTAFTDKEIQLLDAVQRTYGDFSGDDLESFTHNEDPWMNQRLGLDPWVLSNKIISIDDMREYYIKRWQDAQND